MKTCILISVIVGLISWTAAAQTADEWITQGRTDLTTQDLTDANAAFTEASALSPTNETANALYAITRLLVLPSQPAGSNFLTRIGFPVTGRDIYAWTSKLPKDTNGVVLYRRV
jgi:hypothetical protein